MLHSSNGTWYAILAFEAQDCAQTQVHYSPVEGQLLAEHEEQLPGAVQIHTGPSGLDTVLLHPASSCHHHSLLLVNALWAVITILATVDVSLLFGMELNFGLIAASGDKKLQVCRVPRICAGIYCSPISAYGCKHADSV